ncbi:MAG: hypothetical protein FJ083_06050 [Cyanobacteria bacterium K_Offshore_surface_m2_239]|nr:hypothetical protein [Cyanobacteria bacterium K_Offshore_surface_m2_239]
MESKPKDNHGQVCNLSSENSWTHGQIHSFGLESRLKHDVDVAFGKSRYAREDLDAELVAMLLGNPVEIGSETENYAACLDHWDELPRNRPRCHFRHQINHQTQSMSSPGG